MLSVCCAFAIALGALTVASPLTGIVGVLAVVTCAAVFWFPRGPLGLAAAVVGITAIIGSLAIETTILPHQLRLFDNVVLLIGVTLLPWGSSGLSRQARLSAGWACALLIMSELVGFVGSHAGLSSQFLAFWQDMRWLGAVGLGLAIGRHLPVATRITWAFRVLMTWNILNLLVSLAELSGADTARLGIPFTGGVFGHPSLGSAAAAMLIILVMSQAISGSRIRLTTAQVAALIVATACIVLGTRFKALVPLAVVASFLVLFRRRMPATTIAALTAAVPIAIVAVLFAYSGGAGTTAYQTQAGAEGSVLANALSHGGTRVTLLSAAARVARQTAPFGRGLGTFGSNVDSVAEQQTFEAAGLGDVFGYTSGAAAYRSDSFVAHVLAERGYVGLLLFVCAMFPLLVATIRISGGEWLTIAGPVTAIALSPVAATFNSAPMMLIVAFPAALAAQAIHSTVGDSPRPLYDPAPAPAITAQSST